MVLILGFMTFVGVDQQKEAIFAKDEKKWYDRGWLSGWLAGAGWLALAGWLAGWLLADCWLAGLLLKRCGSLKFSQCLLHILLRFP